MPTNKFYCVQTFFLREASAKVTATKDDQSKEALAQLQMQLANYQGFLHRNDLNEVQRKHAQSLIQLAQELQDFNPQRMSLTCLYQLCTLMLVDHVSFLDLNEQGTKAGGKIGIPSQEGVRVTAKISNCMWNRCRMMRVKDRMLLFFSAKQQVTAATKMRSSSK